MGRIDNKKLKLTLLFCLMYGGIVVLVASNSHFQGYHWAKNFLEFMSNLIPSIANLSNKSEFAFITGFYFSSMRVMMPVLAARISWIGLISVPDFKNSIFETMSMMIVIPVFLVSFIFLLGSSENSIFFARIEVAMVSSKVMLVLVGGGVDMGCFCFDSDIYTTVRLELLIPCQVNINYIKG